MALQNVDVTVNVPDVDSWLNVLNDYANDAISNAGSIANSLENFTPTQFTTDVDFLSIDTNVSLGSVTRPVAPAIQYRY